MERPGVNCDVVSGRQTIMRRRAFRRARGIEGGKPGLFRYRVVVFDLIPRLKRECSADATLTYLRR